MSLPNELLIGIFTKLFYESSIKQFLNLRIICKRWNQIIPIVFIDEIKSFYENKLKCRIISIYNGIPFFVQSSYTINFSSYNPLTQTFLLKFNNKNRKLPNILKHDLLSSSIFLYNLYTGKLVFIDKIIDDEFTGINHCICINIKNYDINNDLKNINLEDEKIFIEGILVHGNLLSKILNCDLIIN
ncbi:hypothetical protein RhiirA5_495133 [Rhizophagus irregularis]|uniref:F-box domain-containing protein n=3 Tax=Rhizophagus irregularis TaxID=588596 RepID=A0A2N0Q6T9_9GLOM|nr:hypothetical protein GLOIN_2v1877110 [Rhizophagus irregularis DAOM 181602=DAOM 197198]EXX75482.1 hypothetical protein RirG_041450 [Rhizophagus irregularis DAOM 197198w]PKC14749.1 hypothetical protein RhiirA5_495133 [Rhizophagus irregularis]POG69983.1 hypothetical protein GLOIN_2v1877110 [Rhizophagus irregularis DAOM 181602=DAOM 197198]UZO09564.1 hypothetical protein OCT59_029782 [Rhizophagus irregularis]CAB4496145.1 unnamed protein product [Rhizophagus irregularis]|eukprot:XP_025176849.1 hypothetical protein GLOIN_2v1877110 [Rhizophagus irregularis DAOM 181602=DAOM 197198]